MTLHLCACLGPAPGETLCFCQKGGWLPPEKRTTAGPDGAATMRAIFGAIDMKPTLVKWSAADEAALRELEQRRKLFNDVHMPILVNELERILVAEKRRAGVEVSALAHALSRHADALRDALKPFDSGTRPADPAVIGFGLVSAVGSGGTS